MRLFQFAIILIFLLLLAGIIKGQQSNQTIQIKLTLNDTTSTVYIPSSGQGEVSAGSLTNQTFSSPDHYFLSSNINNSLRALVLQETPPASLITNKTSSSHALTISQDIENSKTFLVFSRGDYTRILNRISSIENGNFLASVSPTFGFTLGKKIPLKFVLNTTGLDISGNLTIQQGMHRLIVQNTEGVVNNRPVINISLA